MIVVVYGSESSVTRGATRKKYSAGELDAGSRSKKLGEDSTLFVVVLWIYMLY
jgi:hypothetical protein